MAQRREGDIYIFVFIYTRKTFDLQGNQLWRTRLWLWCECWLPKLLSLLHHYSCVYTFITLVILWGSEISSANHATWLHLRWSEGILPQCWINCCFWFIGKINQHQFQIISAVKRILGISQLLQSFSINDLECICISTYI